MSIQHTVTILLVLALTAGCTTSSPKPTKSEFDDIVMPNNLTFVPSKSTIIESPTVKAARLVYRGRIEVDSLAVSMRSALEANGWRHISSTQASKHGTNQVYEKDGDSLQVLVWEGFWYTYAEYTMGRVVRGSTATTGTPLTTAAPVTPAK